jgi:acetyltransferase-like isoleucine patch superfamily enzyme
MKKMLHLLCCALVVILPWRMKRWCLGYFFGYKLARTARIGVSWIFPQELIMLEDSRIGNLVVAIHLQRIQLSEKASIGRGNWITGYPLNDKKHFSHLDDRRPELRMGEHSAITKNHHLDCTESIEIGAFTTIAGYRSQLLTHSIDLVKGRQDAAPIQIGSYCFIGTNCVILGGASLPDRSVLAACSLLNKAYAESGMFGGVPAKRIKDAPSGAYFNRTEGYIY